MLIPRAARIALGNGMRLVKDASQPSNLLGLTKTQVKSHPPNLRSHSKHSAVAADLQGRLQGTGYQMTPMPN